MHGLSEQEILNIVKASEELPEIEGVVIFGSRAKRNFKKASDIDLAIKGNFVTDVTVKRLSARLNEELPMPYFFNVVNFDSIRNSDLLDNIKLVGQVIYKKQ